MISLSASTTEALFAVGAGAEVVGRSRFCDYPPEALAVPSVGGFVDPSFEAVLGLAPDLVTGVQGPGGRALVDQVASRGIATYFPPTTTLAEIDAMIAGLAERVGRAERGRAVVDSSRRHREALARALVGVARPRVLVVFGLRPVHVAGPDSFNDEMLRAAGGVNAVVRGPRYPQLTIETVLALDPDVVLDTTMATEGSPSVRAAELPGWKELRAVKEGRVVRVTANEVLRPGPRVAHGIAILARALHPAVALPDEAGSP